MIIDALTFKKKTKLNIDKEYEMYKRNHTKAKYISNNSERGSVSNPGATVTL